ncbi:MAG: sigma-54 dependent transcriptional regulator [bacterium]
MSDRILVVEDDPAMCRLLVDQLEAEGFAVASRTSGTEGLHYATEHDVEAVIADVNMPGLNGIDLTKQVLGVRPELPVILVTAFGSVDNAVAAIRAGAYDFITKPIELEVLLIAVRRAVQRRHLGREVRLLREALAESAQFEEILGESPPMRELFELLARIAGADAAVLIAGESGVGKELVAKALHHRGRRRDGPFVAVNCAAVPETLLESELFGHARGAFTDARADRVGLFVRASGGTLFLDEIGDLPLPLQPKLLRALEERAVRPLGGTNEVPFDVALVCATNADLEAAVEEGRFREDLYFRINVIQVDVPPLRARGNDVLLLAQHYLERFAARGDKEVRSPSPAVAARLLAYPWPGNVRELRNCIERCVALARGPELSVDDLPRRIREFAAEPVLVGGDDPSELVPLEQIERQYILRVLESTGGNKRLAARILGLDRKTLYRKLERYGAGAQGDASDTAPDA